MSWVSRVYNRVASTSQYIADDNRTNFCLPLELTCTPPWAGNIAADYVLSPHGSKKTITGLRSHLGGYVGNVFADGKRRLLVAVFHGSNRERLVVAIAPNMPRLKSKAIASGMDNINGTTS